MKETILIKQENKEQFGAGSLSHIDEKSALLNLREGNFTQGDMWFLRDEDGKDFVLMPQSVMNKISKRVRSLQEDIFYLRLEREISKSGAIDVDDVMSVADEILQPMKKDNLQMINVSKVVRDIKKKHPNLFFDIGSFLRKRGVE